MATQTGSGVTTEHFSYTYHMLDWCMIDDALAGERRVHDQGERYLPKLSKSPRAKGSAYEAYKARARWFEASELARDGWLGSIFRKDPSVGIPTSLEGVFSDIDLEGTDFTDFCRERVEDVICHGRAGILVDHQESASGRAYMIPYKAREILNWATDLVDGRRVLSLVVLRHDVQERTADGFGTECRTEYRVLRLVDGLYQLEIHRAGEGGAFVIDEVLYPEIRKKRLTYIPFVFLGPRKSNKPEIQKPPLLKLVTLNFHHYRAQANLSHGLFFSALPTFLLLGNPGDDGGAIELGPGSVQVFENPECKPYVWEFSGAGLAAVRQDVQDLKEEMAALGASAVARPLNMAETAEALTLKHAQQNTPLGLLAHSCEAGLTKAARWVADWMNVDPASVEIRLNKDFDETRLSPTDIQTLWAVYMAGGITLEVYTEILATAEALPADITAKALELELRKKQEAEAALKAEAAARVRLQMAGGVAANNPPGSPPATPPPGQPRNSEVPPPEATPPVPSAT